jgi:hypothetical protein
MQNPLLRITANFIFEYCVAYIRLIDMIASGQDEQDRNDHAKANFAEL